MKLEIKEVQKQAEESKQVIAKIPLRYKKYIEINDKETVYYPKEFFFDRKQKPLLVNKEVGFNEKKYFRKIKISLCFSRGFNPLNYIAPMFNLTRWLLMVYEGTILKNVFPADFIFFELEVVK